MSILKYKQYDFTFDFFQRATTYPFFDTLKNNTNNTVHAFEKRPIEKKDKHSIHVINDIPPYFDVTLKTDAPSYKSFKISKYIGFLADLKNYTNIEGYMKDAFGTKSRSSIIRQKKRLETCFPIQYKMYFGEISTVEFDFLFDTMKKLIGNRFSQRGDTHLSLDEWDIIRTNAYPLILAKKASLFVIYDGNKPIDICLNYHYQNIMNHMIRSYDIDYSKFRLGYIDLLKQIEWCFLNNYTIFDLSRGDMDYKRQWCNTEYYFNSHIVYHDKKTNKKIVAFFMSKYYQLKEFLKKKSVDILYKKIRSSLSSTEFAKVSASLPLYKIKEVTEIQEIKTLIKININDHEYSLLRKPIYDFQYNHSEFSGNIEVFKIKNYNDAYIVTGKKKSQQICILS